MESFLNFLLAAMPFFHVLAIIGILWKAVLAFGFKHFNLPYLMSSYFRFYERSDYEMAETKKRRLYIKLNNYINLYTYFWIFLSIICLVAVGRFY